MMVASEYCLVCINDPEAVIEVNLREALMNREARRAWKTFRGILIKNCGINKDLADGLVSSMDILFCDEYDEDSPDGDQRDSQQPRDGSV